MADEWSSTRYVPTIFANKSRTPEVEDVCCSWTLVWLNDVNGSLIFASKNIYHLQMLQWRCADVLGQRIDRELMALEGSIHDASCKVGELLGCLGCVQLPRNSHRMPRVGCQVGPFREFRVVDFHGPPMEVRRRPTRLASKFGQWHQFVHVTGDLIQDILSCQG